MSSALRTKYAGILFVALYKEGWFKDYLVSENITGDLQDHILNKANEISRAMIEKHDIVE